MKHFVTALLGCVLLLSAAGAAPAKKPPAELSRPLPANAERVSHGRFRDLTVYKPAQAATSFVLLLSGADGWDSEADLMAQTLVQQGAMVTGIDYRDFRKELEADGGQCVFPDGDLENLSHFVQAYVHSDTYLPPMLVGLDASAALAYATLVQAPRDTFASVLTLNFCPAMELAKPVCRGSSLEFTPQPPGVLLKPARELGNAWVDLQSPALACAAPASAFVRQVRGAALASLPRLDPAPIGAAFAKLASAERSRRVAPAPAALKDLPVVEVPAAPGSPTTDAFAILMTGDGGWAGIDEAIAAALSQQGIPVIGLDSLRYYWTARTPDGVAADTDKMIRYYLPKLQKKRVLLIGYSQGADVLPFAVNRLPKNSRASVALTAILGMSEHALFEFHVSSWISDDSSGPATLPEVDRISGTPLLCIYGADEHDSLCPKLDAKRFQIVKVKGGHHFDGDYAGLARTILAAAKP